MARRRVPERGRPIELRRRREVREQRAPAECVAHRADRALGAHLNVPTGAPQRDPIAGFFNTELSQAMPTREQAIAGEHVDDRAALPARDEHTTLSRLVAIPLDGEAMGAPLARQSDARGQPTGAKRSEPNGTDAADGPPVDRLRTEARRQKRRDHLRCDSVVDEQSSLDDRFHDRCPHAKSFLWLFTSLVITH